MLSRRVSMLAGEQVSTRVHRAFERLRACSIGDGDLSAALLAQSCTAWFLLLAGLGTHPLAPHTSYVKEASVFEAGAAAPPVDAGDGIGAGLAAVGAVVITFYPRS